MPFSFFTEASTKIIHHLLIQLLFSLIVYHSLLRFLLWIPQKKHRQTENIATSYMFSGMFFFRWLGSEYAAVKMVNSFTVCSIAGMSCYLYGRRHIRQAGAFQRVVFPVFSSVFFNMASHFAWAFIKELFRDQDSLDYHFRVICGILSGGLFLSIGQSYLQFIDYW